MIALNDHSFLVTECFYVALHTYVCLYICVKYCMRFCYFVCRKNFITVFNLQAVSLGSNEAYFDLHFSLNCGVLVVYWYTCSLICCDKCHMYVGLCSDISCLLLSWILTRLSA